jgi:hypothetical protein
VKKKRLVKGKGGQGLPLTLADYLLKLQKTADTIPKSIHHKMLIDS